ncbi:MAG: hypothetical protein ONB23_11910 [candidate division KSB1 bacterium]|nr:hypothetical protein [candidate division KSB1 bacterium]
MRVFFVVLSLSMLIGFPVLSQSKGGRGHFERGGEAPAAWDILGDNGELCGAAAFDSSLLPAEGIAYLWLDTTAVHDFFLVHDSDDLDFANESVGISAWVFPARINDVHYVVNKGRQDGTPKTTNYALRIAPDGKLEFLVRDLSDRAQKVTSSFTLPVGAWSFVAVYYDFGAGKVYMWNDPGRPPVDTLAFNAKLFPNNDPLAIGSWFRNDPVSPSIKDFDGAIDDVRISGRMEDIVPSFPGSARTSGDRWLMSEATLRSYPNPVMRSHGCVQFSLEARHWSTRSDQADIRICDVLGREVLRAKVGGNRALSGFTWDLRDGGGRPVPAGVYLVHVYVGENFHLRKKILVLP